MVESGAVPDFHLDDRVRSSSPESCFKQCHLGIRVQLKNVPDVRGLGGAFARIVRDLDWLDLSATNSYRKSRIDMEAVFERERTLNRSLPSGFKSAEQIRAPMRFVDKDIFQFIDPNVRICQGIGLLPIQTAARQNNPFAIYPVEHG